MIVLQIKLSKTKARSAIENLAYAVQAAKIMPALSPLVFEATK
jgi:DNA/RNA-binding domain of Phe-tRNA-synthetase-like protein